MTINKYLQQISPEDLAYVKRYHHEIEYADRKLHPNR